MFKHHLLPNTYETCHHRRFFSRGTARGTARGTGRGTARESGRGRGRGFARISVRGSGSGGNSSGGTGTCKDIVGCHEQDEDMERIHVGLH